MTDCSIAGCPRPAKARGWCGTHYARWSKHGDPLHVTPRTEVDRHPNIRPAAQRVLDKVLENEAGCWVFMGAIGTTGYGRVGGDGGRKGGTRQAHRVVYESMRGPVPKGMDLDHLCRNRACVNPDHLEVVTRSENNRRGKLGTPMPLGHSVVLLKSKNRRWWLAKRKKVLGATDAVAVLGFSPWKTPLSVWLEKTGRAEPENLDDKYEVRKGLALEPLLIKEWMRRTGAEPVEFSPFLGHPDYEHLACTPDAAGIIDGRVVLCEIKTGGWRSREVWWDDNKQIPDNYLVQTLIQMAVTGLDECHVFADIAGDIRHLVVPRDFDFESWALPALADWWARHVVGGEEPDIDPVRDYPRLNRVWAPAPGLSIEADGRMLADIDAYRQASSTAKHHKAIADEMRGRIRVAMREATAVTHGGERVVSVSKSGALTVKQQHREDQTA